MISNAGAKTYWQTLANNKQQQKQAWPGQQQQQSNGPGPGRQPGRLAGWQRRQHFVNHSIYQIRARGVDRRLGDWETGEEQSGLHWVPGQLVGSIAMASVHIIERFLVLLSLAAQRCAHIFVDGALKVNAISPLHVC